MPFIEVAGLDLEAKAAQHPDAADTEHGLLFQPIAEVTAIEPVGERPIRRVVLLKVGVEEDDGHRPPCGAGTDIEPGPDPYPTFFEMDCHHRIQRVTPTRRFPRVRQVDLVPLIDLLTYVAFSANQGHEHYRKIEIGT